MNQLTQPLPGTSIDPRYPDSYRRSMGDTDFHTLAMILLREGLEDHFAERDVYVASSIVLYYKEGESTKRKDPDILVAKKVGKQLRRSYRIWEEKKVPSVLWEITSKRTWRNDLKEKRLVYSQINVKEYFLFDPEGRFLNPRLQGFRTVKGKSVPIKPNADGSLTSRELGLQLIAEGLMVRLIDASSGQPIPTRQERALQAEQRAAQEAQRAAQEAQRAAQETQRAEQEAQRAAQEAQHAAQEAQRAQQEAQRAERAEQRNAELEAELRRLRTQMPE